MPNIIVKVPERTFDAIAREKLGSGIHRAAKAVEGWGDDPRQEALTWVVIEEVAQGNLFVGGGDQSNRMIPVIVLFYSPAGVVDASGREKAARLINEAVDAAKPASDPRPVMTSIMVWDVADGTWGANGGIWHLADFAKAAGYKHLSRLAVS